jgi:hypothetical protein
MDDGDQVIPELLAAVVRRSTQGGAAGGVNYVQKGQRSGGSGGTEGFERFTRPIPPNGGRLPVFY